MSALTLGYSPCPNDTFVFYALVHGLIPGAPSVRELLEDIETLNQRALAGELDVTKVSFHAFAHLRDQYCLLRTGGALGRGCGPLVVARDPFGPGELAACRVAIPGRLTTAALLLRLFLGRESPEPVVLPFREIMPAVARGEVDAGVIIHESRFTYPRHGLHRVLDLGTWWEETTGHPIPLGGILARRSLGPEIVASLDHVLRLSVEYAQAHPSEVQGYIRCHAGEDDDEVIRAHIALYVNDYTLEYGRDGTTAIEDLLNRAEGDGIVPAARAPLFIAEV
ncbi:MAG: 1,4-dihydroxy-6-naphthoate synthase [Candidatus Latescibacterota bacterium]